MGVGRRFELYFLSDGASGHSGMLGIEDRSFSGRTVRGVSVFSTTGGAFPGFTTETCYTVQAAWMAILFSS